MKPSEGADPTGAHVYRISRCSGRILVAIVVGCVLVQAWLARELYRQHHNTLHANGNWTSGKVDVDMGIAGAATYMVTRRGLQHNRLNLGPWYGFQELRSRERIDFRETEFTFSVPDRGYLVVRIDGEDDAFTGVRLSRHPTFPSIAFRANEGGEFTWTEPIAASHVADGENRGRITRDGDQCRFAVNGHDVAAIAGPSGALRVGFRGGYENVTVDDVRVTDRAGSPALVDSFRNTASGAPSLIILALVALAWGVFAYGLHRRRERLRAPPVFYLLGANAILVTCLAIYCATDFLVLSGRHVRKPTEALYRRTVESGPEVQARLEREYPIQPDPSVRRVVFLGSSQTWGSGARTRAETFISRIERRLADAGLGGANVQCINAAISGAYSTHMIDSWRGGWHAWRPEAIVMNMSNNDRDPAHFRESLTWLAERCRADGVKLLFSLEPNSPEHDTAALERNHAVMREVGARFDVPVVDLHGAMLGELDRGFLWWDTVHLTSFGHRLAAEHLAPAVRDLLATATLRQ